MKRASAAIAVLLLAAAAWWLSGVYAPDSGPAKRGDGKTKQTVRSEPAADSDLRGRVVDSKGEPVAGADVDIDGKKATTDESGRFAFRDLGAGGYQVDVNVEGFANPGPADLRQVPVTVPSEESKRPAEVKLTVRRPGSISGRVVAGGEPVPDASLSLYYLYAEGFAGGIDAFSLSDEGKTNGQGNFELTGIAPGRLHVIVDPPGKPTRESRELIVEAGTSIEDLVIDIAPQGVLTGKVVDAKSDEPLRARIILEDDRMRTGRTATTSDDGSFRFDELPTGTYGLTVRANGYRLEKLADLSVGPESAVHRKVPLRSEEGIFGRVYGPSGDPERGAFVRVVSNDGKTKWLRSNGSGGFRWGKADSGVWSVEAVSPHYTSSGEVTARPGEAVELHLGRGGRIRGKIVDASGAPVTGAVVGVGALMVDGPQPYGNRAIDRKRVSNEDGTFEYGPLRPGKYDLRARKKNLAPASSGSVHVEGGATAGPVRLVLGGGGTIEGVVKSGVNGKPIPGARVSVFDMTSPFKSKKTKTDRRGRFTLRKVPAGRRTIRVANGGYLARLVGGVQVPEGGSVRKNVTLQRKKKGEQFGFRGIGASLQKTEQGVKIRRLIPGGGAEKQGLKKGDLIRAVDRESVDNVPLAKIVQKIRGRAGEPVRLTVEREGRGRFDIEITRGRVVVKDRRRN